MLRSIRRRAAPFAIATALVTTAAACASSGGQLPPGGWTADAAPQHLVPGDVVRLKIWREPDLSGSYVVDVNGIVVFPLIGPYEVTGESPESLKSKLVAAYREYIQNPSIDVIPMRRVNVRGAVGKPGLYPIDATMTLADAIALAGGATPNGDPDEVELYRDGRKLTADLNRDTRIADLPIRSGDQLFVPERSWISRNTGIVAAMISSSVAIIITLINQRNKN